MNKHFLYGLIFFVFLSSCSKLSHPFVYDPGLSKYNHNGYTLLFEDKSGAFAPGLKKQFVETFFEVYPKLAKVFNANTARQVVFKIDPDYKGVAATSEDIVRFDPVWFQKNPKDIDVVTHEVMHIVQNYRNSIGPWWLTEGIADYARDVYGVSNANANWRLNLPGANDQYDKGYRVTARFLLWIEKKVKSGFVKYINSALREHTYSDDMWQQYTGKTKETLWSDYIANPDI